jgi:hypothetical protein
VTIIASAEAPPEAITPPPFLHGETFVTSAALSALQAYSVSIGDIRLCQRAYEHPLRVANILHDFVNDDIAQRAYDAVALHDVAQRAWSDSGALASLRLYTNTIGDRSENWMYVSTLLADMDKVEACSEKGRRANVGDAIVENLLHDRGAFVPQHAWATPSKLVSLYRIDELLQNVNLESTLIKAAEMLDNLQHPAPSHRAVLQDIFAAESFYAPVCEALGYDGLSMALRSAAAELRLRRGGNETVLAQAREVLAPLGDHEQIVTDVTTRFEHLLDGEAYVESLVHDSSGHGVVHGHSVLEAPGLNESDKTAWVLWRRKMLGSVALKLARSGEQPADVLGVTIVVEDVDELATTYASIVKCIKANGVVKEHPTRSLGQAYSIQGSDTYIATVSGRLAAVGAVHTSEVEIVRKNNRHQVSKATFDLITDRGVYIPVELMVQTDEDWQQSRWGSAAHLFYKAGTTTGDPGVLRSIYDRRLDLNKNKGRPNPHAGGGGKQLRRLVAQPSSPLHT